MARAELYDQYEDAGLAFSDTDLAAFRPQVWAQRRVNELNVLVLVLKRREGLPDMPKGDWWKTVREGLERIVSWYCVRMEVPYEEVVLPAASSSQWKALTKEAALLVDGEAWLTEYRATVLGNMRHVVTLGRRCLGNPAVSGWKKVEGKLNNRLANCLAKEVSLSERVERQLEARK